MLQPIKTLHKKDLIRRFSQVHTKNMKDTNYDFYNRNSKEERLSFLKTREIIDELTQITIFTRKLEEFGYDNSIILEQIQSIQSKLRGIDQDDQYTQIIDVLSKYLSGIRRFSLTTRMNGIAFYKKLFEGAFLAITRELNSLEKSMY